MPDWDLPLAHGRTLRIDRPLVMAILNATPDSFSDGGGMATPAGSEARIAEAIDGGADILDVGGESTRPGHTPVDAEEELRRVLPVLAAIRQRAPDIAVSIDTRKAVVARVALAAGVDFVNDVSGLGDAAMADVVRDAGCSIVLMRNRDCVGDVVGAAAAQIRALIDAARRSGLRDEQLLVDPGLGFGDPPAGDAGANLRLLTSAKAIGHGRPVVVGASRKRFLGHITGETKPADRWAASVAAAVLAVRSGANVVRVHDVAPTVKALRVFAPR